MATSGHAYAFMGLFMSFSSQKVVGLFIVVGTGAVSKI